MFSSLLLAVLMGSSIASQPVIKGVDSLKHFKKNQHLDEVVVTGQYAPRLSRNSIFNVRTISAEQIKLRSATNIVQLLNTESGVRFSNDLTLGTSDISLMGISGQGVKILLDGIPVLDRGEIRESLSQIDVNSIERIEIVEGPLSVVYGTDALGGVINIITKKVSANEMFSATLRLQEETVGKEYTAFGSKGIHNQGLNVNYSRNKWNIGGSFTRNDFGGWQGISADRVLDWNPKDQLLGGGWIAYQTQQLKISYRLNTTNETITAFGALNPNTLIAVDKDYITKRYFHQLQSDWIPSPRFTLNTALGYTDYSRRTKTTMFDANSGNVFLSPESGSQDLSVFKASFFRTTGYYQLSDNLSIQPGVELNLNNASGDRIKGSPEINDYAAFLSAEYQLIEHLKLRPGIRTIYNSVYDAPPLIPSLNASFELSKELDLRASYGRGFRAPTLRELYFDFFDSSHSIAGNESLKAEYSNSYNVSLDWEPVASSWILKNVLVSGFYNQIRNKIDIAANPDLNGVNSYINIGLNKTIGSSLQTNFVWTNLKAKLGFLYIGRYNQFHTQNTLSEGGGPEFTWSPEVNANLIYTFPKRQLSFNIAYKFNGKLPRYELLANDTEPTLSHTSSFNMADFSVSKRINMLSISAGARNLFNVSRIGNNSLDVGSAHSTGGPVPVSYGRSFFLGLTYALQLNKQ